MSSHGIRTCDLAISDRRFWPRFSGILGALVKWLSSRTYAQVPLLEEVSFFMVWFDPDLPVLRIHLNNSGLQHVATVPGFVKIICCHQI